MSTGVVVLFSVALLAAGCSGDGSSRALSGGPPPREPAAVLVENIAFKPATLEVGTDSKVVWRNEDDGVRHTVTSGTPGDKGIPGVRKPRPPRVEGVFDGVLPDAGAMFGFSFDAPGTYRYFCRIHPSMTAEVVVAE